jgi:hypothetical protein
MDWVQLPPGVDASAFFSSLVSVLSTLAPFFVAFGAYAMVRKIINQIGRHNR